MQQRTIQHKQTSKSWVNAESLLAIDGYSNKYVSIPNKLEYEFDMAKDFSFAMVITVPAAGTGNHVFLNNRVATPVANKGYTFYLTSTYLGFEWSNGTDFRNATYPFNLIPGTLIHVVFTYNAAAKTVTYYVNGQTSLINQVQSIAAYTSDNLVSGSSILQVGKYADHSAVHYAGGTAFLSIYNKALSQTEVSQLYDQVGIVPKSLHANCVGFWSMQERYGNKCYDSVESFNYAKGAPLTPNHADLIGYTDAEITQRVSYDTDYKNYTANGWTKVGKTLTSNPAIGYASFQTGVATYDPNATYTLTFDKVYFNSGQLNLYMFGKLVGTFAFLDNSTTVTLTPNRSVDSAGLANVPFYFENLGTGSDISISNVIIKSSYTSSAKLNFYTKQSEIKILNDNEIKSGLPELKNALKSIQGSSHNVSTTTIVSGNPLYDLFQDEYTVRLFIYLHAIPSTSKIVYRCTCSADEFLIIVTPTTIALRRGLGITGIDIPHNGQLGFYGITATRDVSRSKVTMYVNNQSVSSTVGNMVNLAAVNCTGITHSYSTLTASISYGISYAYRKESSIKEHLEWYNNSLGGNHKQSYIPKLIYWQYNQIDTTNGNRIMDLSGNGYHGTLSGYTVDQLNPAHADYVIKSINSLR